MILLSAKKIKKTFMYPERRLLFEGVDIDLHEGENIAIIGKSGSGKSTLLQILATLDTPTEGTIEYFGESYAKSDFSYLRRNKMGFIFQDHHLLDDYSVLENILLPQKIAKKPLNEALERAEFFLTQVGLLDQKEQKVQNLSGGEKQRIALIRAFINHPKIIFADEPTGNLDSMTSEKIETLLFDIAKKENVSLVIVTHDLQLANKTDLIYQIQQQRVLPYQETATNPS